MIWNTNGNRLLCMGNVNVFHFGKRSSFSWRYSFSLLTDFNSSTDYISTNKWIFDAKNHYVLYTRNHFSTFEWQQWKIATNKPRQTTVTEKKKNEHRQKENHCQKWTEISFLPLIWCEWPKFHWKVDTPTEKLIKNGERNSNRNRQNMQYWNGS